jgi:amino acid transporter
MKVAKIRPSFFQQLKLLLIGKARDLRDSGLFRHVTLIAFFAWVGLGSDGLSSSCYGPEEAYRVLGEHSRLIIIVGLCVVFTIFIVGTSYSQIIRLFPNGGGGYIVATKLLSPQVGMISGSALLIDYVLTIALSVASGIDAIFSFLPPEWLHYKLYASFFGIILLALLNLRGVKESVFSLLPIFILFLILHVVLIIYALFMRSSGIGSVYTETMHDIATTGKSLGTFGMAALILKSFSMGAGTFTGIEAVSNSLPILKEPRVHTGLRTMKYMTISLAFMAFGLMVAYAIFHLVPVEGKTLNAVLLESITSNWSHSISIPLIIIVLISEAALLFIAAQTGFLDGPRVMSSMAQDSWLPKRFAVLSDRLVTQNGVFFMSVSAIFILLFTGGKVGVMIILYSINVFITFALSQTGMVRHWWLERKAEKKWFRYLIINGIGLIITVFILIMVITMKFAEGGWITILITSCLVFILVRIKRYYKHADKLMHRFDHKMFHYATEVMSIPNSNALPAYDPEARTAVICVSEYNGLGIKTFLQVMEDFHEYRNFVFVEVGMVDAGNFKGEAEMKNLQEHVVGNLEKYKMLAEKHGFFAETFHAIGTDVADEIKDLSKPIKIKYPNAVFFIGQYIFPQATAFTRMLHNQTQMAIHNRLSHKGFIMVLVPVKFYQHADADSN